MDNVKLISDVTIISEDCVLLVKYEDGNKYDHQTGWFIPDDLVNEFEHPDDSAVRILLEQTGLKDLEPRISFIVSFKGNDRSWHLVFHYKVSTGQKPEIKPSGDIAEAVWFDVKDLPEKKDIAHHGWALYTIDTILKQ